MAAAPEDPAVADGWVAGERAVAAVGADAVPIGRAAAAREGGEARRGGGGCDGAAGAGAAAGGSQGAPVTSCEERGVRRERRRVSPLSASNCRMMGGKAKEAPKKSKALLVAASGAEERRWSARDTVAWRTEGGRATTRSITLWRRGRGRGERV